jgi:hypothetical protein
MALEFDPQSEYLKVKLARPPFPLKDGLVWLAGLEVKLAKVPQISDPLRTTIITWSSSQLRIHYLNELNDQIVF